MALKTFNPTSPGRRQLVLVDRSTLHKGDPVKALTEGLHKKGGRNNQGRITVRHQGGGAKRLYRKVDFKRSRWDIPAVVERLEYDPNRTAFIALIKYQDGELAYIIAPQRLEVGDTVITSATADIKPGNTLPLKSIPVGTIIHNIELKPQKGAQMVRSAGTYAQLVGRESGYAQIKLASGELRKVQDTCLATIGAVSNPDKMNEVSSKAGRTRQPGRPPDRSRRRHEPGRPPARWWRGQVLGRPSPGHPVGQENPRSEDPQQQGNGSSDHPSP
jgi:large subunit ribosomal protein L2